MTAALNITALATPEAISALTERILAFLEEEGVDRRATHHVALLVEELITNLGTHGHCQDRPAHIAIDIAPTQVRVEILDSGPAFDPREASGPDFSIPAAERPNGGLGLHLVKNLSSALDYARVGEQNRTTFGVPRS